MGHSESIARRATAQGDKAPSRYHHGVPLPALHPDSPLLRVPHSWLCRVAGAAQDPAPGACRALGRARAGATVAALNGYAEPGDFDVVTR
jgi:hypothetical protein